MPIRTIIAGTGSHIPAVCVKNDHFLRHDFRGPDQNKIDKPNAEIVQQFEAITGIRERRYVPHELVTSDIALDAAQKALQSSGIDGTTSATCATAATASTRCPRWPRASRRD